MPLESLDPFTNWMNNLYLILKEKLIWQLPTHIYLRKAWIAQVILVTHEWLQKKKFAHIEWQERPYFLWSDAKTFIFISWKRDGGWRERENGNLVRLSKVIMHVWYFDTGLISVVDQIKFTFWRPNHYSEYKWIIQWWFWNIHLSFERNFVDAFLFVVFSLSIFRSPMRFYL